MGFKPQHPGHGLITVSFAGYSVKGSMRNSHDPEKAPYLKALRGAERLELFDADMSKSGAFVDALAGCDAVFIACLIPTYFGLTGKPAREMDDAQGHEEIVMPTVNGCLNIMRSAAAQNVENVLICSSTSSTNPPQPAAVKNELDHWSDQAQQYQAKKYTSAAKTVMEKAALQFAETHALRLSIFLPTLMLGPAVIPAHAQRGFQGALQSMLKGEPARHEHLSYALTWYAMAALFFAAYENPEARGRYFGVHSSWHWQDIYAEVAKLIPNAPLPQPLSEEPVQPTRFDPTRRESLGVSVRDIPAILEDTVASLRAG